MGITELLGRIGKVIDHNIDKLIEVIVETRANYNQKAYIYNSSGEDSVPVKEDKILLLRVDGTGRYIMMGMLTPSQKAQPGEKIYFGRDQEGKITSKIKMLNDGSYTLDTETETTGEATGNYNRIIKGETDIQERKDRKTLNEANVTDTIYGDEKREIQGNKKLDVLGDDDRTIGGNNSWGIDGDLDITVLGNINIKAQGKITVNGATINLN